MAELPYTANREGAAPYAHAMRSNWGSVSGTGGTWRRRPDPLLTTVLQEGVLHAARTSVPGFRAVSRLGGLRYEGYSAHPYPLAMSGAPCLPTQGSGIDASVGSPGPSLRLAGNSVFTVIVRVPAGERTIQCAAIQPTSTRARPVMRVKANPAIGLNSDLVVTGDNSASWNTLVTAAFTATANGGVRVELLNPDPRGDAYAWFDNIRVN